MKEVAKIGNKDKNEHSSEASEKKRLEEFRITWDKRREEEAKLRRQLLSNIKEKLPDLKELLKEINEEWVCEQAVYRYYYMSFKIYGYQKYTQKVVDILEDLMPGIDLTSPFREVFNPGLNKQWDWDANDNWEGEALPILNAFLHSKHILEMLIKYGEELENTETLPYGWATILLLYGLR